MQRTYLKGKYRIQLCLNLIWIKHKLRKVGDVILLLEANLTKLASSNR